MQIISTLDVVVVKYIVPLHDSVTYHLKPMQKDTSVLVKPVSEVSKIYVLGCLFFVTVPYLQYEQF